MNPLFAVRDGLRQHGVATASQLAAELELPRAVVESALDHWSRRGYAQPVSLAADGACSAGCSSCSACLSGEQGTAFLWHDGPRAAPLPTMDIPVVVTEMK